MNEKKRAYLSFHVKFDTKTLQRDQFGLLDGFNEFPVKLSLSFLIKLFNADTFTSNGERGLQSLVFGLFAGFLFKTTLFLGRFLKRRAREKIQDLEGDD